MNEHTLRKRKEILIKDMGQKLVCFLRDKTMSCDAQILLFQLIQGP